MRRLLYGIPVFLFLILTGYFAVTLWSEKGSTPVVTPGEGKKAPRLSLRRLTGEPVTLDTASGGPVLVNFFASWCVPCRMEHEVLTEVSKTSGVPIWGVDYKDKAEDASKFLARLGNPYREVAADPDGAMGVEYGIYGVPETFVVDGNGFVRKRFVGPLTPDLVTAELLPLLKQLSARPVR